MKAIPSDQIEKRFGAAFAAAFRRTLRLRQDNAGAIEAWGVGQAKDHFSQMLNRVRDGECQLVRRRSEDPVLVMSMAQLADFVELASPRRRFADLIALDPALPVGTPLTISETATGRDHVHL